MTLLWHRAGPWVLPLRVGTRGRVVNEWVSE